jgi:hypothetical protein
MICQPAGFAAPVRGEYFSRIAMIRPKHVCQIADWLLRAS